MSEDTDLGRRIVVGVDGSAHADDALRWALAQGARTGASVDAVACWVWPASGGAFLPYTDRDLSQLTTETVQDAVASAVKTTDGVDGVVIRTHARPLPRPHHPREINLAPCCVDSV